MAETASTEPPSTAPVESPAPATSSAADHKVDEKTSTTTDWINLKPDHPLVKFSAELKSILEESQHDEMFGVRLQAPAEDGKPSPHTTLVILQKFLRANTGDLALAKSQLRESLKWRKTYNPLATIDEFFAADKFGGLGYITELQHVPSSPNQTDVATFNIYGAAAKNYDATFGDIDAFVRWRIALMELTLKQLKLSEATLPIPDYGHGPDPYQMINVHDYLSVSFFRQPAGVRQSSGKIIDLFQKNYPETVSLRYFVNVPWVMQWMMGAMKMLMSRDSIQKMTWLTDGKELHKTLGDSVPSEYGGNGKPLVESGIQTKFAGKGAEQKESTAAAAAAAATTEPEVGAMENKEKLAEEPSATAPTAPAN